MLRITAVRSMALALMLAWATGCADTSGPGGNKPPVADSLPSLIVSGPVRGPGGVGSVTASAPRASGSGSVAYVSLPPGSVPAGLEATIRDLASGLVVTTVVVDGGFDPVAIAASNGDTLVVQISRPGLAPIRGWELVIARRPVVVRTDPPPHKRDVPLNSIMVVVFSAPIDSASLNAGSVQLWRDTTPVAGTVGFGDAAGLRAEFHPDSLLAGLTDYRLVVTPAIRDVNGGALASPVDVQFTTGAVVPAAGLVFASVSAGGQHTCGVTTGGAAYCWGDNTDGQLGNGTTASSSTPVAVAGGLTFRAVSAAASSFTCGVTTSGAAYCWGLNRDGELGLGTNTGTHTTPVAVPGGLTFVTVSTGFWHTCGVTTAGAAYCWGGDYVDGLLGDGTYAGSSGTNYRTPVPVAGGLAFAAVSAGVYHTCGVTTSGAAYCWGVHTWGRLGDGTDETGRSPLPPVAVLGGLTFAAVSAGYASTCGVTTTGSAHCWGSNGWGSLGTGTEAGPEGCPGYEIPPETYPCSRVPVAVMGGLAFGAVSVAGGACGVTALGGGYCWGANHHGQLGDGSTTNSAAPVAVAGEFTFAAISSGGGYSCGVATGGVAYCWGDNNYGQLGTGTTTGSTVPVKVAGQP